VHVILPAVVSMIAVGLAGAVAVAVLWGAALADEGDVCENIHDEPNTKTAARTLRIVAPGVKNETALYDSEGLNHRGHGAT
jgi:hypothetical protein